MVQNKFYLKVQVKMITDIAVGKCKRSENPHFVMNIHIMQWNCTSNYGTLHKLEQI